MKMKIHVSKDDVPSTFAFLSFTRKLIERQISFSFIKFGAKIPKGIVTEPSYKCVNEYCDGFAISMTNDASLQ